MLPPVPTAAFPTVFASASSVRGLLNRIKLDQHQDDSRAGWVFHARGGVLREAALRGKRLGAAGESVGKSRLENLIDFFFLLGREWLPRTAFSSCMPTVAQQYIM